MFFGNHSHVLDGKGRISIPAKFRDALSGEVHIYLTPEGGQTSDGVYLAARPKAAWQQFLQTLQARPQYDRNVVDLRRKTVGQVEQVEIDGQGRILVPPRLQVKVGLLKGVTFVGQGEWFELWDQQAWEKALALSEERLSSNPQILQDLGV